jgi:phosphoribosylglycinamide formyltransferase 1
MNKKRVAVLISGRGSNMAALIEAAKANDYPAEIVLVLSNQPDAAGLLGAREAGITTAVIDHRRFHDDRQAFERALDDVLGKYRIDIVCLAGFLRLLTEWFIGRWSGRILNVHPALLPEFKGLHTHRRALAAGVKRHGATVHFVVEETDAGPIISQESVAVLPGDSEETLAARILEIEHRIYPQALRLVAEGSAKFAPEQPDIKNPRV